MRKFLLFIFLAGFLPSCKTHRVIMDQGGQVSYKETSNEPFVKPKENGSYSLNALPGHINKLASRIDKLERDTVSKQEFDEAIESLREEIKNLTEALKKNKKETKAQSETPKDLLEQAEEYFKDKKWKDAILTYEEFRTQKPQSPQFKEATLKIGKSFLNLGYPKEAQVFFEEIIARFPNSKEAEESQKLLNSPKK